MELKSLVQQWFDTWEKGDFLNLPISEDFKHTSPFGTIDGKETYINIVKENKDRFLGQTFTIEDEIYQQDKACVRYIAKQGKDFALEVSEWYYIENSLIKEIVAYYHIGEIREERVIEGYND